MDPCRGADLDGAEAEARVDAHEQSLTRSYNAAVEQLARTPKGDPRHMRAVRKVLYWRRALRKYQHSKNN